MDYLKNVFGKKQIKLLIISAVSVAVGLIVTLICVHFAGSMKAENMAARWSDDNDYAQVSIFLSELAEFKEEKALSLSYNIEKKLKEDSISADENARLWFYGYSTLGKVSVASKTGNVNLKAIGVGGDFFLFHPLTMISGSVFSSENVNSDLAIVDRDTAFSLFGSTDIVGQAIEINGSRHIINGVIDRDEGRLNRLAGNDGPIIYLSYASMKDFGYEYINMYEALIPNPITHYALDLAESNVAVEQNYYEAIENTGRFHYTHLLKNATKFGTRSMNSKGIIYPYWENMARGMEDYLTPLAVLGFVAFLFPAVVVVYIVIRLWRLRPIHREDIKDYIERLIEKARKKRQDKRAASENTPKKEKKKKEKKDEESK